MFIVNVGKAVLFEAWTGLWATVGRGF